MLTRLSVYKTMVFIPLGSLLAGVTILLIWNIMAIKDINRAMKESAFRISELRESITKVTFASKKEHSSLDMIRLNYLTPYNPSLPSNFTPSRKAWQTHQDKNWQQMMSKEVVNRLNHKRNGFFIECGALDGVFISNTLLLEKQYGWTGLLIEADPIPLSILKARNRHAWVAGACLSPHVTPSKITMKGHRDVVGHGYMSNDVIEPERDTIYAHIYNRIFEVQCFPLGMLMEAINQTEVDYFSLDVEGVELDILKTIQFDKIHIKLISVEVRPKNKYQIQRFLESVGYKKIMEIKAESDFIHDDLYEFQENGHNSLNVLL